MEFTTYSLHNFRKIPQIERLTEEEKFAIEVVGQVLPFKTNNYVLDELINWDNYPNDPIFVLNFPQKGMLPPEHYGRIARLLKSGASNADVKKAAHEIRLELNPHPAGQLEHNVPEFKGQNLLGIQHKYEETMLFFPSQGQTCHAYCTFCFRWPQFVGMSDLKFAMKQGEMMVEYIKSNPGITDVLFTGGDPMVMKAKHLKMYIDALLDADIPHLRTIRLGTKFLAYWPYKVLTDNDADEILDLFQRVVDAGKHLTISAHFNHYNEMRTDAVKEAIKKIRATGADIRSQSPVLKHINDDAEVWKTMWREQADLGIIPYYFFIARNTGAQHYFSVSLERAWEIFREAYSHVSGVCRTVRGPSMSAQPGKIQILGIAEVKGKKVFVLNFIQGRNPEWVGKPFFAKYNPEATWINELKPALGEKEFFYEHEIKTMFAEA